MDQKFENDTILQSYIVNWYTVVDNNLAYNHNPLGWQLLVLFYMHDYFHIHYLEKKKHFMVLVSLCALPTWWKHASQRRWMALIMPTFYCFYKEYFCFATLKRSLCNVLNHIGIKIQIGCFQLYKLLVQGWYFNRVFGLLWLRFVPLDNRNLLYAYLNIYMKAFAKQMFDWIGLYSCWFNVNIFLQCLVYLD